MQAGDRVALTCADLDDDGAGIGELAGATLHVPGALAAEQVEATVAHVSPHAPTAWGRLERVVVASTDRRDPVCPGFGRCGGCAIQHLGYEAQLDWKRGRVLRAFAAHAALRGVAVEAAVASPRVLGYRNNAKLVAARPKAGGSSGRATILGGYAPRTHEVVDLLGCRVVEPALDAVATELRGLLDDLAVETYDEGKLTGRLRYVVLRSNHAGQVLCTLVVARPLPNGRELADRLRAARAQVVGVVEHENRTRGNAIFAAAGADRTLAGEPALADRLTVAGQTIQIRLTAAAFFQANRAVAELVYAALVRALGVRSTDRVVDAYSGVGGIGLALAGGAAEAVGIESNAGAVQNATEAAARNGVHNARFLAGDAAAGLASMDRAEVVVVNPPRRGCAPEVLDQIARLSPRAVGYLSCDPDTLARDLAVLAARGYQPAAVTPYDMLPHTPHVETLVVLRRLQVA
ncbi:MAG: 23S rRNA (uracil(1939)-C(5))-methyltransferase RlmD [Pseudomonadota bacterium]